ncbi:hypothetical protein F2Q69_00054773 [Brassica cretica]|uniref:Uncharacterized protein n=1 Tax=Brassica cretica TaxID=69181 RepID=A0A8S9MQC0_BRACR|nr:hypothetical protein F2Q69_00054773 [Brassica cretica]
MKSEVQPESHRTFQTGHLGGTSDRGSFQRVHLNNQREFSNETNFHRSPTQPLITEAWNYKKGFTEEEVMDFRNWRFPSPSTCEYQLLEVDFSPTMKWPSPE